MIVVLISGRGSNMQALLEAGLPVSAVISNVAGAEGLDVAAARGVATRVVEHERFPTREAFDAALAAAIDEFRPRLVALAGFMRILTPGFVARYAERMLNIHPSLLPAFPGPPHARARARRGREGARLHRALRHRRARSRADRDPGRGAGARRRHAARRSRRACWSRST